MSNPDSTSPDSSKPEEENPEDEKEKNPPQEHWGKVPPAPDEDISFWGEEGDFQITPVIEVGKLGLRPWGGLTVEDLKIADKQTLLILTGAVLLLVAMVTF